jgi:hypothetical protein
MSLTGTASRTGTYTEARLRAIMPEVVADIQGLAAVDIINTDTAIRWAEDLAFVLQQQAARGFQIKLLKPGSVEEVALDYKVSSDGTLHESSFSGGIDYYALPRGTRAILWVDIDQSSRNIAVVDHYTQSRGWGTGNRVTGTSVRDRAYSKEGYGVIRGRIGTW